MPKGFFEKMKEVKYNGGGGVEANVTLSCSAVTYKSSFTRKI